MTAQTVLLSRDQLTSGVSAAREHRGTDPRPGGHARLDLSSLRLLKVPDVAPPFDGEVLPTGPTATAAIPQRDATLPGQGQGTAAAPAPLSGAGAQHAACCDDWTHQFAQLLVETLAGARPPRQLLPWLTGRARVHLRRVAPVLRCGQRPRVLRVLASHPVDGVVEMSVIVGLGSRTRALAVRLEKARQAGQPARWLCTDLETA